MTTTFDRRKVLMAGGLALGGAPLSVGRELAFTPTPIGAEMPSYFPGTDPELVSGVVGAAHTDLDRVVELVTARPHLARAAVDWGFGDWEAALGAASHMGRRDIAEFLIRHGARPNIFSAAMLGQLAVVEALVQASPGVQRIPGPHGITLLAHARAGGEAAAPVFEYLEKLGDADLTPETVQLSEEQRLRFIGTYEVSGAGNGTLEIEDNRGTLWLRRGDLPFGRRIFPVSAAEFYPSGSPTVRIVFDAPADGRVTLAVIDEEVLLSASRRVG